MANNDNDDIIPTLIDETTVSSSSKVPVTILTGYLGTFFNVYLSIKLF